MRSKANVVICKACWWRSFCEYGVDPIEGVTLKNCSEYNITDKEWNPSRKEK